MLAKERDQSPSDRPLISVPETNVRCSTRFRHENDAYVALLQIVARAGSINHILCHCSLPRGRHRNEKYRIPSVAYRFGGNTLESRAINPELASNKLTRERTKSRVAPNIPQNLRAQIQAQRRFRWIRRRNPIATSRRVKVKKDGEKMSMTRQQVGSELRERAHGRASFAANREKVDFKRRARGCVV